MKVNFNNTVATKEIWELPVGATFTTKRTHSDIEGLYMKIDHNNKYLRGTLNRNYAVNLQTGQTREFTIDFKVTPIEAEVNVL